ncbi:serine hydrolase domain-containing protein [Streptomyces sp. PmtG]
MTASTRSSRLRIIAAAALVSAAAAIVPAQAAAGSGERGGPLSQRELRQEAERVLKKAGYVGVTVQVRDGRRLLRAAAGERERGTGLPLDHRAGFRAASLTKSFTATVVLQLAAEKKLSLDDTVERWLPGVVQGNGNDGSRVTLRHLLQHTSGIHNYDHADDTGSSAEDFERTRYDHHDPSELVTGAMRHAPDFPPADPDDPAPDWNYSNPGYAALGMIIEKVTGASWDEQVRDRLVRPLKLSGTYAPGDDPRLPGAYAHAYHQFAGTKRWVDVSERNVSMIGAAGELITTEKDADRFLTALYGGRLLPPAQQAEMRRVVPVSADFQRVMPGLHYGLGAMRQPLSCGGYRWGHGGDVEGLTVRTAVSGDGRRSVVINATGKKDDDAWLLTAEKALQKLLDRTMCAPSR